MIVLESMEISNISYKEDALLLSLHRRFKVENKVISKTMSLLLAICSCRLVTLHQLSIRLFTETSQGSMKRMLKTLVNKGLVESVPFKQNEEGISRKMYRITRQGASVIEQITHNDLLFATDNLATWKFSERHYLHVYGQSFFSLDSLKYGDFNTFEYEKSCNYGNVNKKSKLKMSTFVDGVYESSRYSVYVEQDTGTETLKVLTSKLNAYYNAEKFSASRYSEGCILVSCNRSASFGPRGIQKICTSLSEALFGLVAEDGFSAKVKLYTIRNTFSYIRQHNRASKATWELKYPRMLIYELFEYLDVLSAYCGNDTILDACEWLKVTENMKYMAEGLYAKKQFHLAAERMKGVFNKIANVRTDDTSSEYFNLSNLINKGPHIFFAGSTGAYNVIQTFLDDGKGFMSVASKMFPHSDSTAFKYYKSMSIGGITMANCILLPEGDIVVFEDITYDLAGAVRCYRFINMVNDNQINLGTKRIFLIMMYDTLQSRIRLGKSLGTYYLDDINKNLICRFINFNGGFHSKGMENSVLESNIIQEHRYMYKDTDMEYRE